jgi:hypothetical protein
MRFFKGLGASIFSPVLRAAKVAIPKSIPTALLFLGSTLGSISTTKLTKYLLTASLITVTEERSAGKGRDQTISNLPTLAR